MASAAVAEPDVRTQVFTKEELQALRRRLAGRAAAGDDQIPTSPGSPPDPDTPDWQLDVEIILAFLKAVDRVMRFLIENRVPEKFRRLIQSSMALVSAKLDEARLELGAISSEQDQLYSYLADEGLTLENLAAKLASFVDDLDDGPVLAVLDSADKILGSLCKVVPVLGPVKEMKELVEHRVKFCGDADLISLNLYPKE